jgi:hypothetical protein
MPDQIPNFKQKYPHSCFCACFEAITQKLGRLRKEDDLIRDFPIDFSKGTEQHGGFNGKLDRLREIIAYYGFMAEYITNLNPSTKNTIIYSLNWENKAEQHCLCFYDVSPNGLELVDPSKGKRKTIKLSDIKRFDCHALAINKAS